MRRSFKLTSRNEGVSPVIGVILAVAITVALASVLYIWVMGFTSETEKTVPEPLDVTPELNIERFDEELALKVTIGDNINWDNYQVKLNYSEVKTVPGTICSAGETIFFDYKGGGLVVNETYPLQVHDKKAKSMVYSDEVKANSYKPKGTGIYGVITSAKDGVSLRNVVINLYQNGEVINTSVSDFSETYTIYTEAGIYDLVCEYMPTVPEVDFKVHETTVNISKYEMVRYDILLEPVIAISSNLNGHVYHNVTKEGLAGVEVRITDYRTVQETVNTDSNGYFEFKLQPLDYTIICEKGGYQIGREKIVIEDNKTLTYDIYLDPIPPETGIVHGYIIDKKSGDPIVGESVFAVTQYVTKNTTTDEVGYFQISVVPGNVTIFVNIIDYELWEEEIVVSNQENYLVYIYLVKEKGG